MLAPVMLRVLCMLSPRVQQQHLWAAEQLCAPVPLAAGLHTI
jgi:hypothetical protein